MILSTTFVLRSINVFNHSTADFQLMGVKNGNYQTTEAGTHAIHYIN